MGQGRPVLEMPQCLIKSELVERMAMLETNLAEENKQRLKSVVVSSGQSGDRKR